MGNFRDRPVSVYFASAIRCPVRTRSCRPPMTGIGKLDCQAMSSRLNTSLVIRNHSPGSARSRLPIEVRNVRPDVEASLAMNRSGQACHKNRPPRCSSADCLDNATLRLRHFLNCLSRPVQHCLERCHSTRSVRQVPVVQNRSREERQLRLRKYYSTMDIRSRGKRC
jgi:hypothetical protein